MAALFTREGKAHNRGYSINDKGQAGFTRTRNCGRCGGAGGSDKWAHTGWTCFDCGGKGNVGLTEFVRLYDADKLAKLNAAQDKANATRAAKAQAKRDAEAARVSAERGAIIAAHADILARMRPLADASAFLADMIAQVEAKARPLSERQAEAALGACAKLEAEAARRAKAAHVGQVGQRITLDLEYVRHIDLTQSRYDPVFIIWVFRDQDGNSVVYKGGQPAAFAGLEWVPENRETGADGHYAKGAKIRLVATVKAHDRNRKNGEPETIIQRPKAA